MNEGKSTHTFQICTCAKSFLLFCAMNARRTPHCVTQHHMNLLSVKDRLHLEQEEMATSCWTEASAPNRIKVRVIRVDRREARRCVHSEDSVAFSRSIGVGLDREGSIVSTCTEHHEF